MPPTRDPILKRKIRFALVGCGRIADKHVEAITKHGNHAELVAVCDTDPAALERAQAATGVPGFRSLTELLAGSSAGGICWFEQGVTDSFGPQLGPMDCLGFLPGSFCPHWDVSAQHWPPSPKRSRISSRLVERICRTRRR